MSGMRAGSALISRRLKKHEGDSSVGVARHGRVTVMFDLVSGATKRCRLEPSPGLSVNGNRLGFVRSRRLWKERLDGTSRLRAPLLLKLTDPVSDGVCHLSNRLLSRRARIFGRRLVILQTISFVALNDLDWGFLNHNACVPVYDCSSLSLFNEFSRREFDLSES